VQVEKEGAIRQDNMSNEEVFAAFSDWLPQYRVGTVNGRPLISDERFEAMLATVWEFAAFIEPKPLAQSTKAETRAFKRQIPRGPKSRSSIMGIEFFESFRANVLKPRMYIHVYRHVLRDGTMV
jgi:hypothetical protein